MRLVAFPIAALLFFLAPAALPQEVVKNPAATGAVTPEDMSKRLEGTAARIKKSNPKGADRSALIDFAWAQDENEYRALSKMVLVLIVAVSKNEKELPLKRVYIRDKWGHETTLMRISSERRDVPEPLTRSTLGAHRADGFYLAPSGLMKGEGQILADFAVNRTGFVLYNLPGEPPDFIEADRLNHHAPDAKADPKALKAMFLREYTGFALPDGLQ